VRFAGAIRKRLEKFGETVTYTANGVAGASITAIWEPAQNIGQGYDDGRGETYRGALYCLTSDVASPDRRDTFTIGSTTWQVDDDALWQEDNAGGITMNVVRYARTETSGPGHRIER
jgi:hypothetical protein